MDCSVKLGGPLFLGDVDETSPGVQNMLFRVLETGEIYPLGTELTQCFTPVPATWTAGHAARGGVGEPDQLAAERRAPARCSQNSMPGSRTSMPNVALPVTLAGVSTRGRLPSKP